MGEVLFDLDDICRAKLAIAERLQQRDEMPTAAHECTAFFMRY